MQCMIMVDCFDSSNKDHKPLLTGRRDQLTNYNNTKRRRPVSVRADDNSIIIISRKKGMSSSCWRPHSVTLSSIMLSDGFTCAADKEDIHHSPEKYVFVIACLASCPWLVGFGESRLHDSTTSQLTGRAMNG